MYCFMLGGMHIICTYYNVFSEVKKRIENNKLGVDQDDYVY